MLNLNQRYIAALKQLSQFKCVIDEKDTLTHVLTGVKVSADTDVKQPEDLGKLRLAFTDAKFIEVVAKMYFELQLSEDAAHHMHSVGEGSGEIHKRASKTWEHLSREYNLAG